MSNEISRQRVVMVYTTSTNNAYEVNSIATTWEELKVDLRKAEIKFDKMKAVVGETKVTLESPKAMLPEGNITLFLMPKKTKSGLGNSEIDALPYRKLRSTIKSIIEHEGKSDAVKKAFSVNGKNYTQTGSDDMKKNLKKWLKKHPSDNNVTDTPTKKTSKNKKKEEKVADVIKSSKTAKTPSIFTPALQSIKSVPRITLIETEKKSLDIISGLLVDLEKDYITRADREQKEADEKLAKEKKASAKKESLKKKADELNNQARDLAKDFKDVKNW